MPPNLLSKHKHTEIQVTTTSYEDEAVCAGGSTLRSDENCENYALAAKMNVVGKKEGRTSSYMRGNVETKMIIRWTPFGRKDESRRDLIDLVLHCAVTAVGGFNVNIANHKALKQRRYDTVLYFVHEVTCWSATSWMMWNSE